MLPNIFSFRELLAKNFPTNGSLVIFLLYMAMFVAQVQPFHKIIMSQLIAYQGMFVTASRFGGSNYPPLLV